jgi:8-oxo-dGTP pyrophosphatase MutT (NUDIX family)
LLLVSRAMSLASESILDIVRIKHLDLVLRPSPWGFAGDRRADIAAHFAELCRHKPLWNGRVLLARNGRIDGDAFRAEYFETDFASFISWRDWGWPDRNVFNGFGMGAIRSADGAFLLGEMGTHTANAGKIYFPAGTPEPNDLRDGRVDLADSVRREVAEETGLTEADYIAEDGWTMVRAATLVGFMRVLRASDDADTLKRRIEAFLACETQPELSAIHVVRRMSDCPAAVTAHVRAFLAQALSG